MIRILTIETTKEPWFVELNSLYKKKINPLYSFERLSIKSSAKGRDEAPEKKRLESESLLKQISKDHITILCDENGKSLDSIAFSNLIVNHIESGQRNVDFIIGGAFGVNEEIKRQSNHTISLAPFVLNHLVAQAVLMEQIYRALSIWKGLPYHND